MLINLLLYILSFILIWFGAGLIVSSVDRFARRLHMSSFALSFFILGILTSIPEIAVGINSIVINDPEIFVGNLIGGIIVIILFLIPIFAIIGNGIKLNHQLNDKSLLLTIVVSLAPAFLISDRRITLFEGILMILLYCVLFYFIEKRQGIVEAIEHNLVHPDGNVLVYIGKIIIGIVIVFVASHFIVKETLYFSKLINVSPFIISLIGLSLGTNLPELSVGIRSLLSGKKAIAFGDYVGSAAANTLIFGALTLLNRRDVIIPNHFFQRFVFIFFGLILFYFFARSKHTISKGEGVVLLCIYLFFLFCEALIK